MYRQLLQLNHLQIYCIRGEWCDFDCGKFHRRSSNKLNDITTAGDEDSAAVICSDDVDTNENDALQNNETAEQNGSKKLPGADRAASVPPIQSTPLHASIQAESLESRNHGKLSVSVTLDDIIASARRKISDDYTEIQLPSPVLLDDQDLTLWDKRAAKKRIMFYQSSLDVPAMEGSIMDGATDDFAYKYEDMDSEAELAIQEEPPRFINDEEAEDIEEMIKAARPPTDAFSNPILLRESDPLTTRKKMKRVGGKSHPSSKMLRQLSKSLLQKLSDQSDSRTPSVTYTNDEFDDGADNSSIADGSELLAELSAMVSKSTAQSGATSPANILKFIEEQKQKASNAAGDVDEAEALAEQQL